MRYKWGMLLLAIALFYPSPPALATPDQLEAPDELYLADAFLYIKHKSNVNTKTARITAKALVAGAKSMVRHHDGSMDAWLPLIMGIAKTESSFCPQAKSWANALGIMQVHWPTWGKKLRKFGLEHEDLFNPQVNVPCGIAILSSYLKETNGSVPKSLYKYYGAPDPSYARLVLTNALDFVRFQRQMANIPGKERLVAMLRME